MVLLVVKGTKFPDEFTVERTLAEAIDGAEEAVDSWSLARSLCHLQNSRHHLRLMLLSAHELASSLPSGEDDTKALLREYTTVVEELTTSVKDKSTPVADVAQYDKAADAVRDLTAKLYPQYCTKPDVPGDAAAQREAAIQELYAMHENPELGEDERLVVYHCRAILDPLWKVNESEKEETAGLWFCGKRMEGTLAKYCGRNEKSKVTVKVAPRDGPAPSGEPRMRYEDQRAMYEHMRQRKETYRQLEESELRDRVVQQSRGRVVMPSAVVGAADIQTGQLRPICAKREERIVSE